MAAALDFTYRYPFASFVGEEDRLPSLQLATCDVRHEHPHFFSGRLREPKLIGDMLLALSDVVRTHYFLPRPEIKHFRKRRLTASNRTLQSSLQRLLNRTADDPQQQVLH